MVDHDLRVGFILRSKGAPILDSHFAAMDIGWAQELFGRRGELSAIQLRLTNPRDREKAVAELRKVLPKDATVTTPAQRTEEVDKMLGGFQLNLSAMSLVSLVVGMFLIYNTVSASVARRRREIGILRSLGVTRNEVRGLFLGEAISLGVIGVLLGLVGGTASRAAPLRRRRRNDFVALRAAECEAGRVGAAEFCARRDQSDWLRSSFLRGFRRKRRRKWNRSVRSMAAVFPRSVVRRAMRLRNLEGRFGKRPSLVALERAALPWARGRFFLSRPFHRAALACVCRGLFRPRQFFSSGSSAGRSAFSSRAGRVFRALRRHRGKAAVEAELAAANLSRALSPKLRHHRHAGRGGRDDRRSKRDGIFLSRNRRRSGSTTF